MDGWGIAPPPEVEEEVGRSDLLRIALYELNNAISPREVRLEAIRNAIQEFDHADEHLHDEELELQADRILYQKLAFAHSVSSAAAATAASASTSYADGDGDVGFGMDGTGTGKAEQAEEVVLICKALEMVCRASRTMVALSFAEVGESMLPLMLEMLGDPSPPSLEAYPPPHDGEQEGQEGQGEVVVEEADAEGVANEEIAREGKLGDAPNLHEELPPLVGTWMNNSCPNLGRPKTDGEDDGDALLTNGHSSYDGILETATAGTTTGSRGSSSSETTPKMLGGRGGQRNQDANNRSSNDKKKEQQQHPADEASPIEQGGPKGGSTPIQVSSQRQHLVSGRSDNDAGEVGWDEEKKADSSVDLSVAVSALSASGSQLNNDNSGNATAAVPSSAAALGRDYLVESSSSPSSRERQRERGEGGDDEDSDNGDGLYVGWERADDISQQQQEQRGSSTKQRKSQVRFWDDQSAAAASSAASASQRGGRQLLDDDDDDEILSATPIVAAGRLLKVLRYYSRVLSAMAPMAHHPGLLDALIYQTGRRVREEIGVAGSRGERSGGSASRWNTASQRRLLETDLSAVRIDAIATIVNLACAEENKTMMVQHPGLLDAIMQTANEDTSEEAREHAAIVLMNVAYAEENKVYMVSQDRLLDTLANLMGDESPFTRRYASASLFTLVCVPANAARIARHRNGLILDALSRVLLEDPIDEARVNSAEACFNMAKNNNADGSGGNSTVELMGDHPDLLPALAHAVMADYSADVRAYAARTLEWLAADIHHGMPCHGVLLGALTKASLWTKTTCIAEALQAQSMIVENRPSMIRQDGLLDALASLALLEGMSDEEVRNCSVATIVELSKEESLRKVLARNEGVMTALTRATFLSHGGGLSSGEDVGGGGFDGVTDSGLDVGFKAKTEIAGPTSATKIALKNLANAL